jgi:hypothetical protein
VILEDSGKYWLYQYCRYWKILENFILPPLFSFLPPRLTFLPSLFFLLYFSFLPPLVSFLPIHCPSSHKRRTDRTKKNQYVNTFRNFVSNFPVSTILVLPVFSRIFQYLQYLYNQYFLIPSINRLVATTENKSSG